MSTTSSRSLRLAPQWSSAARATAAVLVAAFFAMALLLPAGQASADRVVLKNGTVLEGTVIKRGNGYWIKTPNGQKHEVSADEVAKIEKGAGGSSIPKSSAPSIGKSAGGSSGSSGSTGPSARTTPKGPVTYSSADRRARAVDVPLAAVTIWQEFIDSEPANAEELKAAKEELAKWKKLADEGAEKIKGKWVGGDERKAILEEANKLSAEGFELMQKSQTLQAIEKLKQAAAVYPNSFRSQFLLGYLMLLQEKAPEAGKYFNEALRLRPDSPETLANLAVLEIDKRQHAKAITLLYKAAQQGDSKSIAINFVSAVYIAGPKIRKNPKIKPAVEASRLLAAKYGLPENLNMFGPVPLSEDEANKPDRGDAVAGAMSSGTGFFIAEDGLILTNRHVVDGAKTFMVMMNDGTEKSAEVVVMDDQQDLALLRVKLDSGKTVPFVQLSKADNPEDGGDCVVMGFPLIDRLGPGIKITRGIVSSGNDKRQIAYDVTIDATVNPGNSGGPILDDGGNVMAIVSMKTIASVTEDTYGLGISAGRIRKFLAKNSITVTAAEPAVKRLSAQEIAAKVKPAAVCILATR
jgi:S1-C subfamily serine protease